MKNNQLQDKNKVVPEEESQPQSDYRNAVKAIKEAILISQYEAIKSVNEKQLMLYYAIGKYLSYNVKNAFWGKDAIGYISVRLQKELPGLRGFSWRNLYNMKSFYEEWKFLEENHYYGQTITKDIFIENDLKSEIVQNVILQSRLQYFDSPGLKNFLSISFTHHMSILNASKIIDERIYYIDKVANEHLSVSELRMLLKQNDYRHQGHMPNNFVSTINDSKTALKAIDTFKDEYLLDYINVEELNVRDKNDIDERVIENQIIHNIKNFILTFGSGFAFIRNQYHLEAFGEDQYIDLLFFNRDLNCLVAVELKTGKFKTSYLGQLSGYLSVLDEYERKPHENPSIGIVLCKDMNKSFVDFVIRDYSKPMAVATYKTSKDMSRKIKNALPDIDELRRLIDKNDY